MRQRIFAVGEQQLVQVGVRAEDPRFRGVARERDIIDRRAELDGLAEELRQLGPLIFAPLVDEPQRARERAAVP